MVYYVSLRLYIRHQKTDYIDNDEIKRPGKIKSKLWEGDPSINFLAEIWGSLPVPDKGENVKILNPKRGDLVRFLAMNEFTGNQSLLTGKVIGKGSEIRKKYPVEMAIAPENYSLVKREVHGLKTLYVDTPEDVDAILPIPEERGIKEA